MDFNFNAMTAVLLLGLAGSLGLQLWLARRQLSFVRAHRDSVPDAFRDDVSAEAHRKAADYTAAKTRLNMVSLVWGAVLLLAWTLGGGLDLMDSLWRGAIASDLWRGVAVVMSVLFAIGILDLPLSIAATFGVEQRFGFNRTTPWLFVSDMIKSSALGLLFGVPLVAAILWIMEEAGPGWWLYAWGVWLAFTLIQTWAYPRFIAPLFNKFSPMTDPSLRARVERLARNIGFGVKDIFVMDGSRRSAHGNAYMTGFGANKRIVFFDTLVNALHEDEVEAVLAHELGHYKLRHVQKKLIAIALLSGAGWAVLGWLYGAPWFYAGLGVSETSPHMALLLFLMVGPVFTTFLRPALSALSRKYEFEADDFARKFSDAKSLMTSLVKLYRDNASTLTPDPVYSAFYHSHPPPALRIRNLSKPPAPQA